MRIFIASGIFHPESGGPATYLLRFLPELVACGHQVSVLAFGDSQGSASYPYPVTRISRVSYPIRQWKYYSAAARQWQGHDLAYIHSMGLPLPAGIRPRIAKIVGDPAWERATNQGWVPPDIDIDTFQQNRYNLAVEANKALRAREARQLEAIIVPSEHRRRMVIGWGVDPLRVFRIYNALEMSSPIPAESQAEARRKLQLKDGPLLFALGRVIRLKGIQHVLQALRSIPECQLVIAGEGPYLPILQTLARDAGGARRIKFVGHLSHEVSPLYYRAADYTILYSGGEGLSHVLLESLSVGTPVIASDKGGNSEVVRHGVNGLLVPYVDVEALAQALREAFSPGKRDQLAANCASGLERFRWDVLVKETIEVLESFS